MLVKNSNYLYLLTDLISVYIIKELAACTQKEIEEYRLTCDISQEPGNTQKNRYGDVLAYDHSRVKLVTIDHEDATDYINANFIPVLKFKNINLIVLLLKELKKRVVNLKLNI